MTEAEGAFRSDLPVGFSKPRRRGRTTSAFSLTEVSEPSGPGFVPATIAARMPGVELMGWLPGEVQVVRDLLAHYGAVRIRGMSSTVDALGDAVSAVAGADLVDYVNRSTPRRRIGGQVFTSTEYDPDLSIPMHNEQSYSSVWPRVLGFWGDQPSQIGGATPLCRSRDMLEALPEKLVRRMVDEGVSYERWYQPNIDLSWQEVFQTEDRDEAAAACEANGIEYRWYPGGVLWTRHLSQAVTTHPASGEQVWFNQANLFHAAALPVSMRQALRDSTGDRPPRDARYGGGDPIADSDIELINETYERLSWAEPWGKGDIVFVDNVAVAHGRHPYQGDRRVLVAMAGQAGPGAAG